MVSATISCEETTHGRPPALTLMPTMSSGLKKRRHASIVFASPVIARIPRSIISRTTSPLIVNPTSLRHFADLTEKTLPGYGPGIPGVAPCVARDLHGVTILYFGTSLDSLAWIVDASGLAARS